MCTGWASASGTFWAACSTRDVSGVLLGSERNKSGRRDMALVSASSFGSISKRKHFIFIFIYARMYVDLGCLQRPEEDVGRTGARVIGVCELFSVGAGN